MKVVAAILAVGLCVACSADSSNGSDSDASSDPTSQPPTDTRADPVTIPCGDNIRGVNSPPTDRARSVMVGDAIALPTTNAAALQAVPVDESAADALPGQGWLWAKQGIGFRGGHRIRLWVGPEASDEVRIGWGHAPIPRGTSVTAECPVSAGWRAFPGGYWVKEPGCYAIHVRVDKRPPQRVDVGIGASCPGQVPPPGS